MNAGRAESEGSGGYECGTVTGADAPRKLRTYNERNPGRCGEDDRLKEAKPSPKVNHLPSGVEAGTC